MRLIVDTQGARLRKAGNRLLVEHEGETLQAVPIEPLEQVILMGQGVSASTPLLCDLVRRGVDVVYQSQAQRFNFRLVGPVSKHSALRVCQVQVATDPARALPLARAVVAGKLHNQAVVLRHHGEALGGRGQAAIQSIVAQMEKSRQAASLDTLRGYEGSGAAAYFAAWPTLFDAGRWKFSGRAYYPPPDPVNAMASLGYTLLLNEIIAAVYRIGLDPTIGFFHTVDYGRPSLALDLEEEFRPVIVDILVLRLLQENTLEPGDFQSRPGGKAGVVMSDDARRFFIAHYQERLEVKTRHPAQDQQLSYRQCIERQVEHMARCILGRDKTYSPLLIK